VRLKNFLAACWQTFSCLVFAATVFLFAATVFLFAATVFLFAATVFLFAATAFLFAATAFLFAAIIYCFSVTLLGHRIKDYYFYKTSLNHLQKDEIPTI
jgi:hypothetical protein